MVSLFHCRKQRHIVRSGKCLNDFERFGSNLARRHIDNAHQADGITRIYNEFQIRHNVFNFFTIIKSRTPNNFIGNSITQKHFFHYARLCVGSIQDDKLFVGRIFIGTQSLKNFLGDHFALMTFVARHPHLNSFPAIFLGP